MGDDLALEHYGDGQGITQPKLGKETETPFQPDMSQIPSLAYLRPK